MTYRALWPFLLLVFITPSTARAEEEPATKSLEGRETRVREDVTDRLERAEAELREIVGSELLNAPAPRLPTVSITDELPAETWARIRALLDVSPSAWSETDRDWLRGALDRHRDHRILDWNPAEEAELEVNAALPLLRAGRLLGLEGSLARLRGEETLFADLVDRQTTLVERLHEQPGSFGAILAMGIYRSLLVQLQDVAIDPSASASLVEGLDEPLRRWLALPDAGVVLARDGLETLATVRDGESMGTLSDPDQEPGFAALAAPVAELYRDLARSCRAGSSSCQGTISEIQAKIEESSDGFDVIAFMMGPNVSATARQRTGLDDLTELARAAVALRLRAEEIGSYPADLGVLPAPLAVGRGELAELEYVSRGNEGAELSLRTKSPYENAPRMADRLQGLSTWKLPPVGRDG